MRRVRIASLHAPRRGCRRRASSTYSLPMARARLVPNARAAARPACSGARPTATPVHSARAGGPQSAPGSRKRPCQFRLQAVGQRLRVMPGRRHAARAGRSPPSRGALIPTPAFPSPQAGVPPCSLRDLRPAADAPCRRAGLCAAARKRGVQRDVADVAAGHVELREPCGIQRHARGVSAGIARRQIASRSRRAGVRETPR